eukprot:1022401_1
MYKQLNNLDIMPSFLPSKHKSTKKFFWAITSQTECVVSGFVRRCISINHKEMTRCEQVKLLIAKFAATTFVDSKILKFSEIDSFLSLLSNQFDNEKLFFHLAHRGSDHAFDIKRLRSQLLGLYDNYVLLLETNHGSVFGVCDHRFDFVLRAKDLYLPKIYVRSRRNSYIRDYRNEFQIKSTNCMLKICEYPHLKDDNLCVGVSGFNANRLCGGLDGTFYNGHQGFRFRVIDYELFVFNDENSMEWSDDGDIS